VSPCGAGRGGGADAVSAARGEDYTLEYAASLDARQPDEHKLTYFQTVFPSVAMGGSVTLSGGSFCSAIPSDPKYGVFAAYTKEDGANMWMAQYQQAPGDGVSFRVRHFREINEQAKLMTEFAVKEDGTSETIAAMDLPLRQEPFMRDPYTSLKASISSSGVMKAMLEHALAAGSDCMGRLELGASIDPFRDTNSVTVGYFLQA
jgi:hypothetical protein